MAIILASIILLVVAAILALALIVTVRGALIGFRQALGDQARIRQTDAARAIGD